MEFTIPTTKSEMFATLKTIYAFYRLHTTIYTPTLRNPLILERLSFTPLTDSQLLTQAESLILPEVAKFKIEKSESYEKELNELQTTLSKLNDEYTVIFNKIDSEYEIVKQNIKSEGVKKGLSYSSYLTEKLYEADKDKAEKIVKYQSEKSLKEAEINSKITAVTTKKTSLDSLVSDLQNKLKQAKFVELKDNQDKTEREVFKYNNSLDEREQRYVNTNISQDAELEVKFLDLTSRGFSKDALVDLGYYADVVTCISGYYNTLSAQEAYQDMRDESRLLLYLDDFYQDFLYLYKTRAN